MEPRELIQHCTRRTRGVIGAHKVRVDVHLILLAEAPIGATSATPGTEVR
jgi:hypothetical protein